MAKFSKSRVCGKVPERSALILEIVPEFLYNTILDRSKEAPMLKPALVVSIQTDRHTDERTGGHTDRSARPTQPCIPLGSLNRVPASAGVRAGMSPLPGGR